MSGEHVHGAIRQGERFGKFRTTNYVRLRTAAGFASDNALRSYLHTHYGVFLRVGQFADHSRQPSIGSLSLIARALGCGLADLWDHRAAPSEPVEGSRARR